MTRRRPVGESSVLMRGSGASRAASRALVLLGIALVSLLGCTAREASTPEERYRPEFEELIAKVGDDEPAASILQDYRLDEVEIEQLHDAYVSCVADKGFPGLYFDSITGSTGFSRGVADDRFNDARKAMDDGEQIIGSPGEAFTYLGDREEGIRVFMECSYDPTNGDTSESG